VKTHPSVILIEKKTKVQDKLDRIPGSRTGSVRSSVEGAEQVKARPRAEDEYEILCNEALLPLGMTLAAVRQYVWRQSAELVMHYRRKRGCQLFASTR